jgi:hypothetical protein
MLHQTLTPWDPTHPVCYPSLCLHSQVALDATPWDRTRLVANPRWRGLYAARTGRCPLGETGHDTVSIRMMVLNALDAGCVRSLKTAFETSLSCTGRWGKARPVNALDASGANSVSALKEPLRANGRIQMARTRGRWRCTGHCAPDVSGATCSASGAYVECPMSCPTDMFVGGGL